MNDTLGTTNAGLPLEELVQIQAVSVNLREAVMACLCGRESRRWTIAELLERFKQITWRDFALQGYGIPGLITFAWSTQQNQASVLSLEAL